METGSMAPNQDAIRHNIERTVDKAALRKVRNLVDTFEGDERARKAHQMQVMAKTAIGITLALILGAVVVSALRKEGDKQAVIKARTKACQKQSIVSQEAAMEKSLRAANPGITAGEVSAKLAEFAGTFESRASNLCAGKR